MAEDRSGRGGTSEVVRRAVQQSPESLRVLAARYGINPKTVGKWRQRTGVDDLPPGPRPGVSRKLTAEEEEIVVRFREHTLLPLDDCLYALQARIPHLSRSSLHRCLQRHGISRLDTVEIGGNLNDGAPIRSLGCFDIDVAQVRSADGVHYLYNAIDEASKFVFVQMRSSDEPHEAANFLAAVEQRFPVALRCVRTPEGRPFQSDAGAFAEVCRQRSIRQEVAEGPFPWSRGRMGRSLSEAMTFSSEAYIEQLLREFVHAYNFGRRLKSLKGCTPYGFLRDAWQREPSLFVREPTHETLGLEIVPRSSTAQI